MKTCNEQVFFILRGNKISKTIKMGEYYRVSLNTYMTIFTFSSSVPSKFEKYTTDTPFALSNEPSKFINDTSLF